MWSGVVQSGHGVGQREPQRPGFHVTEADIGRFLEEQRVKGLSKETLARYRCALDRLYQMLPPDKQIGTGSLIQRRDELLSSGFSRSTVNLNITVWDCFLDFVGHREYQVVDRLSPEDKLQPELTRNEYLRLLQTAKALENERVYMLVLALGSTGIRIQNLSLLTMDALREGKLIATVGHQKQTVRLPKYLRSELSAYAHRNGVLSGPIFVTRNGRPMTRAAVASSIQKLGDAAGIPEGKSTARALRRLYQQTRANIEANMEILIEQAMNHQLEQEGLTIGWDA